MSISTPRRSSSGNTSAALPTTPTDERAPARLGRPAPARPRRRGRRRPRRGSGARPGGRSRVAVDVDDQADAVVQGHGERLRAAHAAAAAGQGQRAGQGAAEPLRGDRGERLVGALHDALGADVDPRAGGHLAVHGQAELLEPAELRPGGPVADQVASWRSAPAAPTRGCACTPTGRPDWTSIVSSASSVVQGADHRVERRASRGRPGRCRRRRPGRRGARRPRGRGCSCSIRSGASAAQRAGGQRRAARGADGAGAIHVGSPSGRCGRYARAQASGPVTVSAARDDVARGDEVAPRPRSPGRGSGRGRGRATVSAERPRRPRRWRAPGAAARAGRGRGRR